jgi:phosphohistidine phosphatase SixA
MTTTYCRPQCTASALAAWARLVLRNTSRVRAPLLASALAAAACFAFAPAAFAQQTHSGHHAHGEHHADHHGVTTTVIVVRHAERADEDDTPDPELSLAGGARAAALAEALAGAGVTGIITTQFLRTRATAQPLADRLGLGMEAVETRSGDTAGHVRAVVDAINARHAGGVVLVVGHSNTTPAIVRALGGQDIPDMERDEYGTMYVVFGSGSGSGSGVRVIRARF